MSEKKGERKKLLNEKDQERMQAMLSGQFRDTGRIADSPGEFLDSVVGSPIRTAISAMQKGEAAKSVLLQAIEAVGKDPKGRPTGVDIAYDAGIRNPYAGAAAATFLDLAAQVPTGSAGGKSAGGVAGTIKKATSKAEKLLKKIDTPEKAVALKGAKRDEYLKALDEVYGPTATRAPEVLGPNESLDKIIEAHAKQDAKLKALKEQGINFDAAAIGKGKNISGYTAEASGPMGKVGSTEFEFSGSGLTPADMINDFESVDISKVDKNFRRKGIASELYRQIEKESGVPVRPSSSQSRDGAALWGDMDAVRPFGNSRLPQAAFDPRFKDSPLLMAGKASADLRGVPAMNLNRGESKEEGEMENQKPKFDPDAYLAKKQAKAFDPDAYLAAKGASQNKPLESYEEPGLLEQAGSAVIKAGQFIDSYTGAPTRSGLRAMQKGENPLSAFAQAFGEDPALAPSGEEIALAQGVPGRTLVNTAQQKQSFDERFNPGLAAAIKQSGGYQDQYGNPAVVAGLGVDIAADPTNVLPGVALAKLAGRGARGGAKMVGEGVKAGGEALARTSKLGNAVVETAKATKKALDDVFSPKRAQDFQRWVEVASKNGIDPTALPESIEFGPGSVISRTARTVREGPVGQEDMLRFENALMQVDSAVDQRIANIGGGLPLNDVEAGQLIRKGFDDSVDELFNRVDFTYRGVIQQAPDAVITPEAYKKISGQLNDLEGFANGLLEGAITKTEREQAKQLLRATQGVRTRFSAVDPKAGTFGTLKQLYEAMQPIGRHAFKKGGASLSDVPVDRKKFQDLYFTMREAFINSTAAQLGDDVAESLIDSNQQITMFLKDKEPIAKLLENSQLAPEKLFKSLISGGDTNKIAALKEILSPDQFSQLKGAYLEGLITRNSNETINFGALRTRLQKNQAILSVLFEPDEIRDFSELVLLGEKFGPAVLSTSGTGGSNIFRNMLEGIKSGATNRTTLGYMKEAARGRALAPVPYRDGAVIPFQAAQRQKSALPRRTTPEEVAKYLQIMSAQETAEEKRSAAERRLEAIKKLRGAGQ